MEGNLIQFEPILPMERFDGVVHHLAGKQFLKGGAAHAVNPYFVNGIDWPSKRRLGRSCGVISQKNKLGVAGGVEGEARETIRVSAGHVQCSSQKGRRWLGFWESNERVCIPIRNSVFR